MVTMFGEKDASKIADPKTVEQMSFSEALMRVDN
jgi:hypothetical protein